MKQYKFRKNQLKGFLNLGRSSWIQRTIGSVVTVLSVTLSVSLGFVSLGLVSETAAEELVTSALSGQLSINNQAVERAVVYLLPEDQRLTMKATEVVIRQKDLKFLPDFFVLTAGSTVSFENHDDKIHNIRSRGKNNPFDTGAHLPGTAPKKVTFNDAGLVEIECSVHLNMRAVIFVTPSPLASVTNAQGGFDIADIPVGGYRLKLWHPGLSDVEAEAASRSLKISDKPSSITLALTSSSGLNLDHSQAQAKDWTGVLKEIEVALDSALSRWKKKRRTSAATRLMTVQSKLYFRSGLKDQIEDLKGEVRAMVHDDRMNTIRKMVQGVSKVKASEAQIKTEIAALLLGLRADLSISQGR